METTMNEMLPDRAAPAADAPQPDTVSRTTPRAGRPGDDVVRWAEFRLALWIGGFALAVIISGQGLLFSAILGLKDDIGGLQGQIGGLHGEIGGLHGEIGGLYGEIGNLRADMQTQFGDVRVEMQELRVDVQTQIGDLRTEMQTQINDLRTDMQTQFGELRERIVRIETHLGVGAAAADKES